MTSVSQDRGVGRAGAAPVRQPVAVLVSAALDAYGADLQLLESVAGLRADGWRVVVVASRLGRSVDRLAELGADLIRLDFPVLMRADASAGGLARLGSEVGRALPRMVRTIRGLEADVVYVNTLTMPWWLLAGRLAGVPTLCHVHEAEARDRTVVRLALSLPLLLARRVIVNSRTTEQTVVGKLRPLRRRTRLVYNGVTPPAQPIGGAPRSGPARMVVVGRISPRKSPQTAVEATAILRRRGRDVRLELCGTAAPGAEDFQDQLRQRASEPELAGAVTFTGYVAPVWTALERADVVVAPSLGESFGNAVVEAQMAGRPVVATAVQGHLETVEDGTTGILVPCADPEALADSVQRLLDDPEQAEVMARRGRESAMEKFTCDRYRGEIATEVDQLVGRAGST